MGEAQVEVQQADGGVSIKEAAERLGLSDKAVRERIKNNKMEAWQITRNGKPEWRVRLPEEVEPSRNSSRSQVEADESPSRSQVEQLLDGQVDGLQVQVEPSRSPSDDLWREFLHRHEEATVRLGYLQAQAEQMKALQATEGELREKAEMQGEKARQEALRASQAEQRANEEAAARRKAEQEAEDLRRTLGATEAALEAERSRSFLGRLFRR
jgi:excisionase family DNA binding protein